MTEAELQEQVRVMCAQLGLYHYHPHDARRSAPGWPDSTILNLATGQILYRELKTASGQLTGDQKRIAYALQAGGHDYAIWRPADLVSGLIGRRLARLAGHQIGRAG